MLPKSLSASSLAVASLCLVRWRAEYLDKTRGLSNPAADLGTAVHGAFEQYVRVVYLEKSMRPDLNLLKVFYTKSYMVTFGTSDTSTALFRDGEVMVQRWFERTSFEGVEVLSVENKLSFDIPYDQSGSDRITVPFNYIMDRLDRLADGTIRVVDYKSVRVPIQPQDLHGRIQARAYGLAAQIMYPDAPRIQVVFDLLRHDPVGVVFTRKDNVETWKYLKNELARIIEADTLTLEPTLNSECRYCPVKATCPTLTSNTVGGGVMSITPESAVELKYKLQSQLNGVQALIDEVDTILQVEAAQRDELEWMTKFGQVQIGASRRRTIDTRRAADIIGPDLMAKCGGLTVGTVEDLLAGPELSTEQKEELNKCISYKTSNNLTVKIVPASKFEE